MKNVIMLLAVSLLATGLPAMAAGPTQNGHDEKRIKECQILIKNCGQEADSIQQKISLLQKKINKGTTAYSNEELNLLELKLHDAQQTLANLPVGS